MESSLVPILWIMVQYYLWFLSNGKAWMTKSKLTSRERSFSILSMLKDIRRSWPVEFLILFLIIFSLLKDLSPLATVTGKVGNILRAIQILGNRADNFKEWSLFKSSNGFKMSSSSTKLDLWICFTCSISEISSSFAISFGYFLEKITTIYI